MKKITSFLYKILHILFLGTLCAYLLGRMGAYNWFADLFSHWQGQYLAVSLVCLIGFLIAQQWKWLMGSVVLSLFLASPFFNQTNFGVQDADIYFLNALYTNDDAVQYIDDIRDRQPAIVAIVELPKSLKEGIVGLGYQELKTLDNKYDSMGFFARQDTVSSVSEVRIDDLFPYPIGHISYKNRHIVLIHPYPGILGALWDNQQKNFAQVRSLLDDYITAGEHFVVLGDFNSSVFSPVFQKYFSDFHASINYSWNRGSIMTIPIDHALSDTPVGVSVQPRGSSDHSALVVDLEQ